MVDQPDLCQMTALAARGTWCGINAANWRNTNRLISVARVAQTFKIGAGLQKPMATAG